jgi:hypothetical protein
LQVSFGVCPTSRVLRSWLLFRVATRMGVVPSYPRYREITMRFHPNASGVHHPPLVPLMHNLTQATPKRRPSLTRDKLEVTKKHSP